MHKRVASGLSSSPAGNSLLSVQSGKSSYDLQNHSNQAFCGPFVRSSTAVIASNTRATICDRISRVRPGRFLLTLTEGCRSSVLCADLYAAHRQVLQSPYPPAWLKLCRPCVHSVGAQPAFSIFVYYTLHRQTIRDTALDRTRTIYRQNTNTSIPIPPKSAYLGWTVPGFLLQRNLLAIPGIQGLLHLLHALEHTARALTLHYTITGPRDFRFDLE